MITMREAFWQMGFIESINSEIVLYIYTFCGAMECIPLHSWEMGLSIQYHVTLIHQLNYLNLMGYYLSLIYWDRGKQWVLWLWNHRCCPKRSWGQQRAVETKILTYRSEYNEKMERCKDVNAGFAHVSSIYIWSKNCSHSSKQQSEAKYDRNWRSYSTSVSVLCATIALNWIT